MTHGANFKLWREQIKVVFCSTNDTCDAECAKHMGIYRNGFCRTYEVLEHLCLKVDILENTALIGDDEDNSKTVSLDYEGGCF